VRFHSLVDPTILSFMITILNPYVNVIVRNAHGKKAIELVRDVEIGALLMDHDVEYRQGATRCLIPSHLLFISFLF